MSKNAVYHIGNTPDSNDFQNLKKLSLLFDKIYISEFSLRPFDETDRIKYKIQNELWDKICSENPLFDYLEDNNIICFYTPPLLEQDELKKLQIESYDRAKNSILGYYHHEKLNKLKIFQVPDISESLNNLISSSRDISYLSSDIITRIDTCILRENFEEEFTPFLKSADTFNEQGKKEIVIKFVLSNIPEPNDSTSWEQIMEFRGDEDVRNKYLDLINWINEVALSAYSITDIKEKYEYLYSDYMKHFKLHKMKYNNTMLEVLVTAGAAFLLAFQSGGLISPFKTLLKMNLSHVKLLEEENKLPGKEVAYIFEANQQFGS